MIENNIIETTSIETIYTSLAKILGTTVESLKAFMCLNLPSYIGRIHYEINLKIFYDYFNTSCDQLKLIGTTFNHVTTRLSGDDGDNFRLQNLEGVLLGDNTLTRFCADNEILFKKDTGITVYYKNKKVGFEEHNGFTARPRSRLTHLNDSCVNGFLFSDHMPHIYQFLTGMPEIISDIFNVVDRQDLKNKYFENMKCYLATCYVALEDLVFDGIGDGKQCITEKVNILLQLVITYLSMKISKEDFGFDNPIIRLPDNKNVAPEDILHVKRVFSYKEIFKN